MVVVRQRQVLWQLQVPRMQKRTSRACSGHAAAYATSAAPAPVACGGAVTAAARKHDDSVWVPMAGQAPNPGLQPPYTSKQ